MGCTSSNIYGTPTEYVGGFPWSHLPYKSSDRPTPSVSCAQYVRLTKYNSGNLATSNPSPNAVGYEVTLTGQGAKANKVVVFHRLVLKGISSVEEVHCLASTIMETNHMASKIGTIHRCGRKELVEIARELSGTGPEIVTSSQVEPPPDGPATGKLTAGDAPATFSCDTAP